MPTALVFRCTMSTRGVGEFEPPKPPSVHVYPPLVGYRVCDKAP